MSWSGAASAAPSDGRQQFGSPRRPSNQRSRTDEMQSGNPAAGSPYNPQHPHLHPDSSFDAGMQPQFNLSQPNLHGSQHSNVVPSNANPNPSLPGALQPGGSARPAPLSSYTAPSTVPSMPPIQTNASQYAQAGQTPSRANTFHNHSRSSPGSMDGGQKYIPFSQTPNQTPTTSNPKAYNISHATTPSAGPSHSPLNLTDIRSRAVSDANDTAQGTAFFSYSDTPTNSNYLAPFPTYAYDWCKWPVMGGSGAGKMAVGSYLEDPHNFIQILDTRISAQEVTGHGQTPYGLEYTKVAEATCAYPVTRILWEPPSSQKSSTDLLATSGDHLRLWSLPQPSTPQPSNNLNRSATVNMREPAPQKLQPLALLSNSKTPEHTAPLTSLDWNTLSPKLIITSSIDTTCTIWDIPTLTAKTQLIAHDKEVFDVRFCAGSVDVFVSCGADGSVRMFDLRSLEHSTIIYEPAEKTEKGEHFPETLRITSCLLSNPNLTASSPLSSTSPSKVAGGSNSSKHTLSSAPPLLRLAASPHDAHLLATFAFDSRLIRILDVRQPGTALLELRGHQGSLNSLEWNPARRGMLASGGDDSLVLIWDLLNAQNQASLPSLNGSTSSSTNTNTAATTPLSATGNHPSGTPTTATSSGAATSEAQAKGPFASWRCPYEVANVSWAPQSPLTTQGGDWLGVCAGRGVWSVKL